MIIDGRKIAAKINQDLAEQLRKLDFRPVFCDIVVGSDPVSLSYVKIKERTAREVGFEFLIKQYSSDIHQEELADEIQKMNRYPAICGLIIQLPLPKSINRQACLNIIDPKIDVDCLGQENSLAFYGNKGRFVPPTASAIIEILDSLEVDLNEKTILILGQGELVGRPVSHLLKTRKLRVVDADRSTVNLKQLIKNADVIISGTGQAGFIRGNDIKSGSIVIDAGTAESDGGIVGDVDFATAKDVASLITPVPGGVGPVTVAKLLQNVLLSAQSK